jgi:ABC-type antimicrobial peptide transport system permease subunit
MIAVLSTIVAGIGIYALMTFVAAQRRRELGIRVALGSQPRRLFLEALFGALRLVGAGVVLGLIVTVLLVRGLSSQVFGLTSADAATHAGAAALVFVVSTIAVWVPARRAMRTDPLIALRGD